MRIAMQNHTHALVSGFIAGIVLVVGALVLLQQAVAALALGSALPVTVAGMLRARRHRDTVDFATDGVRPAS